MTSVLQLQSPKDIDFHFHAGTERTAPMIEYLQWAQAQGRKLLGVVDHFEYYVTNKYYPSKGQEGFEKFLAEIDASTPSGLQIANGMEIELETLISVGKALDPFLRRLKYLMVEGHFTTVGDYAEVVGHALIISGSYGIPVAIAHPLFPDRIEKNFRYMKSGLPFKEFRLTQGTEIPDGIESVIGDEEIEKIARIFTANNVLFEINMRRLAYGDDPEIKEYQRRRVVEVYKALKEGGVKFSIGSDIHKLNMAHYNPNDFCEQAKIDIGDIEIARQLK